MEGFDIEKIKAGDEDALRELFEALIPRVRCLVRRYSLHTEALTADDLFQEIILKLYSNLQKYDPQRSSLLNWCMVIARNVTLDCARRKQFVSTSPQDSPNLEADSLGESRSSQEAIDFYRVLKEAIDMLPKDQRRFVRERMEGKEYDEIAGKLGVPEAFVRKKHEQALEMLTSLVLIGA